MKISRRLKRRPLFRKPLEFVFIDEFHMMQPESSGLAASFEKSRSANRTHVKVQQGIIRRNSGKRVRFITVARREDGSPLKAPPQKFYPAQVTRAQT